MPHLASYLTTEELHLVATTVIKTLKVKVMAYTIMLASYPLIGNRITDHAYNEQVSECC